MVYMHHSPVQIFYYQLLRGQTSLYMLAGPIITGIDQMLLMLDLFF